MLNQEFYHTDLKHYYLNNQAILKSNQIAIKIPRSKFFDYPIISFS